MRYLVGFGCLLFLFSSCEQEPWQPLFNGTDLEGWMVKGEDATFKIEDGVVIGTNQGRTNTFLATNQAYGDFILELEVWVDPRMNSGIQFRSAQNEKGRVYGYQAEIDPSPRAYSGGIYDEARRDWLYPLSLNPAAQKAFRNNEWNTYRIEAYGSSLRVWVNGICTALLEDDWSPEGFIALQVHGVGRKEEEGRQAKWRNVRIIDTNVQKWLKPVPPDLYQLNLVTGSMSLHEVGQGFRWIWDPDQMYEIMPDKLKAQLENRMIRIDSGLLSGPRLGSEEIPANFEMSFQYRVAPGSEYHLTYLVHKDFEGKRYQIVDPARYSREEGEKRPGAVYGELAPHNLSYEGMGERYLRAADSWNQGRIKVLNGTVEHWMNGFKIVAYQLDEEAAALGGRLYFERQSGQLDLKNLKYRPLQ